ncbi:uncharacterized protein LOC135395533 [Ornithodoros turicata]|uniref:uncharacterized protein LOC135395533 n=1 Tax=Ornithodoros turicata TaxID=34597 RepID=UPI003138B028
MLTSLGVESVDDLQFVTEDDVSAFVKPIQARRLIANFKVRDSDIPDCYTTELLLGEPQPSPSPASNVCATSNLNPNWMENFKVPWDDMPASLKRALQQKIRPTPRDRRKMVRLIVARAMELCPRPLKHQLSVIAQRIINEYPNSFKDCLDGTVIGSGYDSLLNQFCARVENELRNEEHADRVRVRKSQSHHQKEYGCKSAPKGTSSLEECEREKESLKDMHMQMTASAEEVTVLMNSTFPLQHKEVRSGTIAELKVSWPYLFEEIGLFCHFKNLVGLSIKEQFVSAIGEKKTAILQMMEAEGKPGLLNAISDVKSVASDPSAESMGVVVLLIQYFNEDVDILMRHEEIYMTQQELENAGLPLTPFLVAFGEQRLKCSCFALSIDGVVVNQGLSDFNTAFTMLMAAYFTFGICYPPGLEATLEFIQRGILGINPDRGSKTKKRRSAVNKKVLDIVGKIAEIL